MTSNLEWNVFYYNINSQKIIELNIFEHGGFLKDVEKCLKQCENKDDFAKEIKSLLMYYFWAKSEYEIIISAWCGGNGKEAVFKGATGGTREGARRGTKGRSIS